jgi:hypothetical protein
MAGYKLINEILNDIEISVRLGWSALDEYVDQFDMPHADVHEIIAILRGTFRFRENLPSWEKAMCRGRLALKAMGRDPDSLLKGLAAS